VCKTHSEFWCNALGIQYAVCQFFPKLPVCKTHSKFWCNVLRIVQDEDRTNDSPSSSCNIRTLLYCDQDFSRILQYAVCQFFPKLLVCKTHSKFWRNALRIL